MKSIHITFSIILVLVIQACTNDVTGKGDFEKPALSGKVFSLSDSIDENKCVCIRMGTDNNVPTYIFLNDSVFIKTIDNCCDPSTISHYSGLYKVKRGKLFLSFDAVQTVYYSENIPDSVGQAQSESLVHIENEPSESKIDSLEIFHCKNNPYFREVNEPWAGKIIALTGKPIDEYVKQMKKINIWVKIKRTR